MHAVTEVQRPSGIGGCPIVKVNPCVAIEQLSSVISPDELYATIDALQHIGSTAGVENSRFYLAPGNLAAAEYIYERMAQYGLNVRYEDLMVDTGAFATNVVGELPGRDTSKVYLVFAHFDSLSADSGPAPGADDNASGVAGMLEIARVLSAFDLPYSVRFVALNAEEVVFQGADAFARRAVLEEATYVAAFNLDAIGSPDRNHQLVVNGDSTTDHVVQALLDANARLEMGQELLIHENPKIISDDTVLRSYDIPTVLISRAVVGDNPVHHTADDLIENLDLHGATEAATLTLAALGLLLLHE